MTSPKGDPEKLAALLEALGDRTETAPDQEIVDDAVAAGIDVKAEASRVRGLLADAVLRAKKQRLASADDAHGRSVAVLSKRAARLPTTPAAQKALLGRVMQRKPEMRQSVMTLQHRDFESFSDADVESALRQLDALGLLDDELASDE